MIPMDKKLLSDYIDACELIRETEQQIRRLLEKLYGALWKLMEYEDTGVDPEEVEQNYGRRKLMKKIRAIAVAMVMTVLLSGCYDYGRDITIICPVINYMAVDGGAIVIYEMDGERREKKFLEKDVYACDESSRIIAVGKVYEDGSKSLRLYLYLSEEDYAQYTKYRFDLD